MAPELEEPGVEAGPEEEGDTEGEDDGDGEEEDDGDEEGLGDGEPVLVDGNVWHVVSVFVAVLAAAAARAVVTTSPADCAWAMPGRPTSPPSSTKLPATKLTVAVRTGLKRINIACLR